jgi:type I restriction enzyme S subunit
MPVSVPDIDEQKRIIQFLRNTGSKTEKLIRAKRWVIELLNEQKQAVIQSAVTKGLNAAVRLKNSGFNLLGHIPQHWQIGRLGTLTSRIGDGLHGTPEYVDESPFAFINGNNLLNGAIRIKSSTGHVSEEVYHKHKLPLDETTLLLSINGTIGNVAYYSGESVILGKSAAYLNCGDALSRSFLYFLLQSPAALRFFQMQVTGTTISNLSLASIRKLPVPLPPLPEQMEIVAALSSRTNALETVVSSLTKEISVLREYRTRLIADVVTGKLDVRGVALPDMDAVEEVGPLEDVVEEEVDSEELVANEES